MDIRIELTGTTPLLMKNGVTVSKDHPATERISEITAKGTKEMTRVDRLEIAKLEFISSLYLDSDGELVYPTANILKCVKTAGGLIKKGAAVSRALIALDLEVPLVYDGPRDATNLWQDGDGFVGRFKHYVPVGIGQSRTMRMRPKFVPWSLVMNAVFLEDALDLKTLVQLVERAGQQIGLGDNRVNGFGRFRGVVAGFA